MPGREEFFDQAFNEAFYSLRNDIGGPFGAVIVKDGKIIGRGGNRVTSSLDPTAHAEVVAIRDACHNLATFDLSDAEIYSTCEPCPMCLSAIYWANISRVFYCLTRLDAENIGFRDKHIYNELPLDPSQRTIPFVQVNHPSGNDLFKEWLRKTDRVNY